MTRRRCASPQVVARPQRGPARPPRAATRDAPFVAPRGRETRADGARGLPPGHTEMVCVVPQPLAGDGAPLRPPLPPHAPVPPLEAELSEKRVVVASSANTLDTLGAKPNLRVPGKRFGNTAPERLRRESGSAVSDRIRVWIPAPGEIETAIGEYHDWIANELLAPEVMVGDRPGEQQAAHEVDLDGSPVRVALTREP